MKAPLVAWLEEDGGLVVDGDRVDPAAIPSRLRGRVAYLPLGSSMAQLEELMRPGDRAYRSREGDAGGVKLRVGDGWLHLVPAHAWGIDAWEPEPLAQQLLHFHRALLDEGMSWAYTVASVAGRICRAHVPELRQLPPRYRWLAHAAVVGGPCLALRGGGAEVSEVDIRGAYLIPLDHPVPVPGTWAPSVGLGWEDLAACDGLIEARVSVPRDCWELPPLPLRWPGLVAWPTGQFSTVTTIPYLAWCERERGVEVLEVLQAAVCMARPIHAPAAARIRSIADPTLRKLVHCRYWGRLAALGGYEGTTDEDDGEEQTGAGPFPRSTVHRARPKRRPGSRLWWRWSGRGGDESCPPDYMPCSAAYISTGATHALQLALDVLAPGSLVMAHVDALWTTDTQGAAHLEQSGGWKVKGTGPMEVYGVGMGRHGDRLLSAGYRPDRHGPLTPSSLQAHAMGPEAGWGTRMGRVWHQPLWERPPGALPNGQPLPPIHQRGSYSEAPHVHESRARNSTQAPGPFHLLSDRWNHRGWPRGPAPGADAGRVEPAGLDAGDEASATEPGAGDLGGPGAEPGPMDRHGV